MNNWFLLAAIPVFGLCVLVHEFGHFITAKWAGIRVDEFGIGFPPRLVGFRKRDSGGWEVIFCLSVVSYVCLGRMEMSTTQTATMTHKALLQNPRANALLSWLLALP